MRVCWTLPLALFLFGWLPLFIGYYPYFPKIFFINSIYFNQISHTWQTFLFKIHGLCFCWKQSLPCRIYVWLSTFWSSHVRKFRHWRFSSWLGLITRWLFWYIPRSYTISTVQIRAIFAREILIHWMIFKRTQTQVLSSAPYFNYLRWGLNFVEGKQY